MKTNKTSPTINYNEVSDITINYNPTVKASKRAKVTSSDDAYKLFHDSWKIDTIQHHETFKVMLLNRANKCLGICTISEGGIYGTVADSKLIFQCALKANATQIILAHNHPSSNIEPSETDIRLTRKIKECGIMLDMPLFDHLILSDDKFYSFADNGML